MTTNELTRTEPRPEPRWFQHNGAMVVIIALAVALLWAAHGRRPLRPSDFYRPKNVRNDGDPVASVFDASLARLTSNHADTHVVGRGGSAGSDGVSGDWYSEQHRSIHCSPAVARELMLDLQTWLEFAARRAGVKLRFAGDAWQGDLLNRLSYRYTVGPYKGVINLSLEALKVEYDSVKAELTIPSYELRWDIRETARPRRPIEVSGPDGNRWELTGRDIWSRGID